MDALKNIFAGKISAGIALLISVGVAPSCAPRPIYRAPLPISRTPDPAPAPPLPPGQESIRTPFPEDPKIKEQNLPTKGTSTTRVLKETPAAPAGIPAQPGQPPPLPDDSSLLAKITPGIPPQRAASLRLTEEGRKLIDAGASAKGLQRLEQSIAIDSTNPYGYFYLAKAHHKLGRYRESLNFLDIAESRLAGEPYWLAEVHALMGENFRALGMTERAEASFSRALSINSGNRTAAEAISRPQGNPAAVPR